MPSVCRSSTCKPVIVTRPYMVEPLAGGGALLAVLDCDDPEALQRLRQILPETGFVGLGSASAGAYLKSGSSAASGGSRPALTGRQREILLYLSQGASNKQIARKLGLSHFTVRNHVSKLLQLLNVTSRRELAAAGA